MAKKSQSLSLPDEIVDVLTECARRECRTISTVAIRWMAAGMAEEGHVLPKHKQVQA